MQALKRFAAIALSPGLLASAYVLLNKQTNKEQFKLGRITAQHRYDTSGMNPHFPLEYLYYDNFFSSYSDIEPQSASFYLGFKYQEYDIMSRLSDGYVASSPPPITRGDNEEVLTAKYEAWVELHDTFKKSDITYEQLSKFTGKPVEELRSLMEHYP